MTRERRQVPRRQPAQDVPVAGGGDAPAPSRARRPARARRTSMRQPVREVRLGLQDRDRGELRRRRARSASSRTCSVVISARRGLERGVDRASSLEVLTPVTSTSRTCTSGGVAQPQPAARQAREHERSSAAGRAAAAAAGRASGTVGCRSFGSMELDPSVTTVHEPSVPQRVDVARAERQQQVAARAARRAGSARPRRSPAATRPAARRAASAAASATSRPGDAGEVLGALPRGVDLEHDREVGERERGAELARLVLRARVAGAAGRRRRRGRGSACGRPRAWRATSVGWWA